MNRSILTILTLCVVSGPSLVADSVLLPFYLGVGYGNTEYKGELISDPLLLPNQRLKGSAKYYEAYLGWRLNKFMALEGGFAQFGEIAGSYETDQNLIGIVLPKSQEKVDFNRYSLMGVAEFPVLLGFSVFGTAGMSYYDFERTLFGGYSPVEGELFERVNKTSTSFEYGAGLKYTLLGRLALRAQWTRPEVSGMKLDSFRFSGELHF